KVKSKGPRPSAATTGRVSRAAPTRTSTISFKPARAIFSRAIAACFGLNSSVISLPPGAKAREPNCAVATQRANFQNIPRALHARQHPKQFAFVGCDADRRESRRVDRLRRRVQNRIGRCQQLIEVAFNAIPFPLRWAQCVHAKTIAARPPYW